jgi:hypothetical protein
MSETVQKPPTHLSRIISLLTLGPKAVAQRLYDQSTRIVTGRPIWKYSRITPQLYIGGQHRKHGWDEMGLEGITSVVNMREKHLDDTRHGIHSNNYLHLATLDNTAPTMDDLLQGAKFIDKQIAGGGKVYIHCGIGIGRAPTQAAAYMIYAGMSANEALTVIRAKRPFIHLTSKQYDQLNAFDKIYRGKGKSDVSEVTAENPAPKTVEVPAPPASATTVIEKEEVANLPTQG